MSPWKKFTRSLKKNWDTYLRPVVEPLLRATAKKKLDKEVERFKRKHDV